jgi:hypothetical protein
MSRPLETGCLQLKLRWRLQWHSVLAHCNVLGQPGSIKVGSDSHNKRACQELRPPRASFRPETKRPSTPNGRPPPKDVPTSLKLLLNLPC